MAVRCPKCSNVFTPTAGQPVKCPKCGFSGGAAKPAAAPPPPAAGAPAAGYAAPAAYAPQGGPLPKGMAVASMVLGIVSCCIWIIPIVGFFIAIACGIVAVILAIMAMKKIKLGQMGGKGMAITGMVLGIITVALGLIGLILSLFMVGILENLCKDQPSNPACSEYRKTPAMGDGSGGLQLSALMLLASLPIPGASRLALKLA